MTFKELILKLNEIDPAYLNNVVYLDNEDGSDDYLKLILSREDEDIKRAWTPKNDEFYPRFVIR